MCDYQPLIKAIADNMGYIIFGLFLIGFTFARNR
jgi:hypothetical protein